MTAQVVVTKQRSDDDGDLHNWLVICAVADHLLCDWLYSSGTRWINVNTILLVTFSEVGMLLREHIWYF